MHELSQCVGGRYAGQIHLVWGSGGRYCLAEMRDGRWFGIISGRRGSGISDLVERGESTFATVNGARRKLRQVLQERGLTNDLGGSA